MKLFISHSFKDKRAFDDLCLTLENAKIPYWNPKEMAAGTSLRAQLQAAITVCPVCVFIATRDSLGSGWCQAEVGAFWGAGKPVIVYLADEKVSENSLPKQFKDDLYATGMREVLSSVQTHLASAVEPVDPAHAAKLKAGLDSTLKSLSDLVHRMSNDERQLFRLIALQPGKGLQITKAFQRDSEFHETLRRLRDRGIIQPTERGTWNAGKHVRITEIGRALLRSDHFRSDIVADGLPSWWKTEYEGSRFLASGNLVE